MWQTRLRRSSGCLKHQGALWVRKMAELDGLDHLFVAPSTSIHRIQEAQTTIYHALWELTLAALSARG